MDRSDTMWNCSAPHPFLLPYSDDYGTFCRPTISLAFPLNDVVIVVFLRCSQVRRLKFTGRSCGSGQDVSSMHVHALVPCMFRKWAFDISSCLFQETEFVVAPSRLPAEYDLCHSLNLSPSLHGLQTPTLFAMNGSENYLGTFLFPCVFHQRLIWENHILFHPLKSR